MCKLLNIIPKPSVHRRSGPDIHLLWVRSREVFEMRVITLLYTFMHYSCINRTFMKATA